MQRRALGAQGRTAQALSQALRIPPGPDSLARALRQVRVALGAASADAATLNTAQAAWVRRGLSFLPAWQERARDALRATGRRIDFARPEAARTINAWVARETRGMIPQIVDQLPGNTEFVLTNAIHFAGRWAEAFDPGRTRPGPFLLPGGGSAEVPLMGGKPTVAYATKGAGHAVRLPYRGGRMAMTVITARRPEDVGALTSQLRQTGAAAWLRDAQFREQPVQLLLPRFSLSTDADLLGALRSGVLASLTAPGANLRGITGRPATIDAVLQRARVKADEQGTVAAAATAAIGTRSMMLNEAAFSADRPFMFILGLTNPTLPLFVGYVGDASHAQA